MKIQLLHVLGEYYRIPRTSNILAEFQSVFDTCQQGNIVAEYKQTSLAPLSETLPELALDII